MKLTIAQDQEYVGNDYWNWRAWIDGKPADLDKIEKVKWFLHPSFPKSVVVSRERSTGFRLETAGWGTFTLRAEAHCVDGSVQTLRQPLKLFYPEGEGAAQARSGEPSTSGATVADLKAVSDADSEQTIKTVFLSYAASDRRRALAVRNALKNAGLEVLDDSGIDAGQPFEFATRDLLANADATVAYLSSELPSGFVAQEINASFKSGKPTFVVTGEALGSIAGIPPEVKVVRVDPSAGGMSDSMPLADLAGTIKAKL